jgi:hypothetical protein
MVNGLGTSQKEEQHQLVAVATAKHSTGKEPLG